MGPPGPWRTAMAGSSPNLVLGWVELVWASAATLSVSARAHGTAARPRARATSPILLMSTSRNQIQSFPIRRAAITPARDQVECEEGTGGGKVKSFGNPDETAKKSSRLAILRPLNQLPQVAGCLDG